MKLNAIFIKSSSDFQNLTLIFLIYIPTITQLRFPEFNPHFLLYFSFFFGIPQP